MEAGARDRIKPLAAAYHTKVPQQRRDFFERGTRDMVRDVATLWCLFLGVNQRYLAERRALTLQVGLLHAIHDAWLLLDKPAGPETPRERIIAAVDEIVMWEQAVGTIQQRYLEGVHPLILHLEEHLTRLGGQGEVLAERFNDAVE